MDFHQLVRPSPAFLYQLGSFFCNSPNPAIWTKFIDDSKAKFGPCPPNFNCLPVIQKASQTNICFCTSIQIPLFQNFEDKAHYIDTEVEPWWIKYLNENFLFVAYLADERTLAADHREKGRTYDDNLGAPEENCLVKKWNRKWDSLPTQPITFDLHVKTVPNYKIKAVRMSRQHGSAIVSIFDEGV